MPEYLSISQIMQSAVTPVFLLAGIGALLSVMTGRLGRITDRLRYLQIFICKVDSDDKEILLSNRKRLISRTKFINTSIFFCALSGLIVCIVIGSLFVGGIYQILLDGFISVAFIFCMMCLILALIFFIFEILFATKTSRKNLLKTETVISRYLDESGK